MLRDCRKIDRSAVRASSYKGRARPLGRALYKEFIKDNKDISIDYATFKELVIAANEMITDIVTTERDGFSLPKMLGYIFIGTFYSRKAIDLNTSQQLGKIIYHTNLETGGKLAKLCYTNYPTKYPFENHTYWYFTGCRPFKKKISTRFKDNYENYIELTSDSKISHYFYKRSLRNKK